MEEPRSGAGIAPGNSHCYLLAVNYGPTPFAL